MGKHDRRVQSGSKNILFSNFRCHRASADTYLVRPDETRRRETQINPPPTRRLLHHLNWCLNPPPPSHQDCGDCTCSFCNFNWKTIQLLPSRKPQHPPTLHPSSVGAFEFSVFQRHYYQRTQSRPPPPFALIITCRAFHFLNASRPLWREPRRAGKPRGEKR